MIDYLEPCRFIKIVYSSLLSRDYFYKSIWREAIYEQKERLEEPVLRMALNSEVTVNEIQKWRNYEEDIRINF